MDHRVNLDVFGLGDDLLKQIFGKESQGTIYIRYLKFCPVRGRLVCAKDGTVHEEGYEITFIGDDISSCGVGFPVSFSAYFCVACGPKLLKAFILN